MFRNAYRRFADGHESIFNNYTVSANSVAGVRWFELRRTQPGNWLKAQESTYQPDTTWRWMGSIASDNQGNVALGFSASSSSLNPQIRYAGRLTTDPVNTLSGEQHLFDGTGSQSGTGNRWGDYSDITVDPVDDCTFYYTNEYYTTTTSFSWRTRIGYFKFSGCTAPQKGTAHFAVTACSGGAAISNALVSIDGRPYGATLSNGTYDAVLTAASHSYSVAKTGVGTQTGNFTIANGQITNVNVCLGSTPSPTPTNGNGNGNVYACTDCNSYCDRNSHGNGDCDGYSYSHGDSEFDSYSHSHSYGYANRDCDPNSYCNCDPDACDNANCAWLHSGRQTKSGSLLEWGVFEQGRHLS